MAVCVCVCAFLNDHLEGVGTGHFSFLVVIHGYEPSTMSSCNCLTVIAILLPTR